MTNLQNTDLCDHAIEKGDFRYLMLVCLVASLGGLLFGFDTAVISGTVDMVTAQFSLTELQSGWFTSSAIVGCIGGALVAGWLGDRFGRKPVLIVSAMLFFISALGSAIPPSFRLLIIARIIGGIGVGMASVLAPLYISEFSPPRVRGRLVATYQLSIVIGILAAYFSNFMLQQHAQGNSEAFSGEGFLHHVMIAQVWRGMFGAEMIPAVLFFLLLFLIPESPRWLINAGMGKKGMAILTRVSGAVTAQREFDDIEASLSSDTTSIKELFRPGLRTALMVGVGLSVFGQMTGVNIVIYYGPSILKQAGLALGSALQYQVALGIVNLIFTLIALSVIDRLGRRPLLIGGMAAVVLTLGIAGVLFSLGNMPGLLLVVVLGVYMASVALSICAVIWVLTPEIFPTRVRGKAMSIATLSNWGTNALSAQLFPWYVATLGMHVGFFTFAAICLVATLFFWRFVPETKGRSLEDIERMWKQT
jgi:SP family arabinose:H+ symporter-like MFS transporter